MLFCRRLVKHCESAIGSGSNRISAWSCTLLILFLAFAAVLTITNLWMFNTPPCWFSEFESNTIINNHRLIHLISIATRPLPAIALITIDSIARHMPNAIVNLHVIVEENIPSAIADERKGVLGAQIQFFKSKGLDINLIFHNDTASDFKGTPLEAANIKQRHVGGYYGVQEYNFMPAHAADVYRSLIMFKYGGIYTDYNNIFLRDPQPLFEFYGPNMFTNDEDVELFTSCEMVVPANGWFTMEPNHSFMAQLMDAIAATVKYHGVESCFPWNETSQSLDTYHQCQWGAIGSHALTPIHKKHCKNLHPPLIVNTIPEDLEKWNTSQRLNKIPEDLEKWDTSQRFIQTVWSKFLQPIKNSNSGEDLARCNQRNLNYVVISKRYMSPQFGFHNNFFDEYNNSVTRDMKALPGFVKRFLKLEAAYQIHVFGHLKSQWLEYVEWRDKPPLFRFVHEKACKHLCDAKTLRSLVEVKGA